MPRRPRLGQHFLTDERVVHRQVGYAELAGDETVLEVGPGTGILTRALAEAAREVVAVELDAGLAAQLTTAAPANVRVVQGDAVKVELPPFDACVSNLPYRISSPFTFRLLDLPFDRAVLMYQKEFAERLAAAPDTGAWSRLSVNAQLRAHVEILETVPRGAFSPPPRVASALVRLVPRDAPPVDVADQALYDAVVHAAFLHRRKKLANALQAGVRFLGGDADALAAALAEAPHRDRRPGKLDLQAFADVARHLHERGIRGSLGEA